MKTNYLITAFLFALVILSSCSGSDVYRGNWKATDAEGKKYEINFEPKKFSIKNQDGKIDTFEYTQNSVKIENSVTTYGIQVNDGRTYSIFFPIANDTSKGVILFQNNQPVYTISRSSYIQYKELYTLNK